MKCYEKDIWAITQHHVIFKDMQNNEKGLWYFFLQISSGSEPSAWTYVHLISVTY